MSKADRAVAAAAVGVLAFIVSFGFAGYHAGVLMPDGVALIGWQAAFVVGGIAFAVVAFAGLFGVATWFTVSWVMRGA